MEDYKCWTTSNQRSTENPTQRGENDLLGLHTLTDLLKGFENILPVKKQNIFFSIFTDSLEDETYLIAYCSNAAKL